jgi:phage recombination protein Bet
MTATQGRSAEPMTSDVATLPTPAPDTTALAVQSTKASQSLLVRIAQRYGVEQTQMLKTLKDTAFRSSKDVSNEQMVALLVVAEQYKLNPFTKELFAFPDERAGIVPVVSIDGWTRIMQEHPEFDGYDVRWSDEFVEWESKQVPTWCEIVMYRKDRGHQIVHREWFDEVRRMTAPWKSHPRRMLEHKTVIQTARRTFGFAGIYDEDEAQRIGEVTVITPPKETAVTAINASVKAAA